MRNASISAKLALAIIGFASPLALADIPYFNGFESPGDVNDFLSPTGQAGVGITQVPSGGGTLGYTAAAGNDYAEIHNTDSFSSKGLGDAGVTNFGSMSAAQSTGFVASVDIYIDKTRWVTQGTTGSNFVLFIEPYTTSGQLPTNTEIDGGNFQFTADASGNVSVATLGPIPLTTITQSGWYRFSVAFTPDATTGNDDDTFSVHDLQGNLLGNSHTFASFLPAVQLGSSAQLIFGPWQDGFAGDTIAIDDLQLSPLPEPATLAALPLCMAFALKRKRR